MRDVMIVLYQLGTAGRTAAVFDQCRLFLDAGLCPTVVTLNYDLGFAKRVATLREQGVVPAGVAVINIYEEVRRAHTLDPDARWSHHEDESVEGLLSQDDEFASKHYKRYFDEQGQYIKFRRWRANGSPVQTTYFRDRRRHLRREYDSGGACAREIAYDHVTGNPTEERYITPDGFCYVSRWLHPTTGRQQGVYAFDRRSRSGQRYSDNVPWHVTWLDSLARASEEKPIIIAEAPSAIFKVLQLSSGIADRLFMFHNSHLAEPFTDDAHIEKNHQRALQQLADMPALVVLTERQARDIRRKFGDYDNVVAIPNVLADKRTRTQERAKGRIGVFARLVPFKGIDDLIDAMVEVHARVPHARLHIFGQGYERKPLEERVASRGLSEVVTFEGRVSGAADRMAQCAVTVSTSRVESFGLSMGESLAVGTPVVAYDIKYGPSDVITHGKDGYLVPRGDVQQLGERLVELLNDPGRAEHMGEAGRERVLEDFGPDAVRELWLDAFRQAGDYQPPATAPTLSLLPPTQSATSTPPSRSRRILRAGPRRLRHVVRGLGRRVLRWVRTLE